MPAKNKPEIHAYRRMNDELRNGSVSNVLLFYGIEDYLVRWAVNAVRNRYVSEAAEMFDFTKLDAGTATAEDIISACETVPMLSERRVVLLTDVDAGGSRSRKDEGHDQADDSGDLQEMSGDNKLDRIAEYIADFPESAELVMTCSGMPDKRRKFFKAVKKYGEDYDFARLDRNALTKFAEKRFRMLGCECDRNTLSMLIDVSGYFDRDTDYVIDRLVNDIEKAAAHSGGHVTREDITEAVSGNENIRVFDFTDSMLQGRKGRSLHLLEAMLENNENEFRLLGLICSQFETILKVSEMRAVGMSQRQIAAQLHIHEYRVRLAWESGQRYRAADLRHILMKAYEIDRKVKSGEFDMRTALELFVSNV